MAARAALPAADATAASSPSISATERRSPADSARSRPRRWNWASGYAVKVAADFAGPVDADGRPLPLSGVTVQLATHARMLVIDARRLAVLIDSDPAAAAAWRKMSQQA